MGAGAPSTTAKCPACGQDFTSPTGAGRPKTYCTEACRSSAANARKREGRARGRRTPTDEDTTPADGLLALAASLVKAHLRGDTPLQLVHLHEQLQAENRRLVHALGSPLPSPLAPNPPAGSTPALCCRVPSDIGVPDPPTDPPAPAPPTACPPRPGRLAAALRTLFAAGRVSLRDLARETRLGEDYVEGILSGHLPPTWTLTLVLTDELGGDRYELRSLWDQSRRVCPDAPRDALHAARALAAHLRGLWLAAARPAHTRFESYLPTDITTAILDRRLVPDWPQTRALTLALEDDPEWSGHHWRAADYATLIDLNTPIPSGGLPWHHLITREDPAPTR
ncbi:hypothetical protein [Embleya sp. AB8]|uniref:hypothetical protein n=1 Tax=Embleya sp. AB8 TaxID=3156304 RepID=UPI003C71A461